MRYVVGFLKEVSFLSRTIVRQTIDSIDLENRVTIEVHTASFRSVRAIRLSLPSVMRLPIGMWKDRPILTLKS